MARLDPETAWENVSNHVPVDSIGSFFSYEDGCGAKSWGIGAFAWFPDQAKLLTFIKEFLPLNPPGPRKADSEKGDRDCTKLTEVFQSGMTDPE